MKVINKANAEPLALAVSTTLFSVLAVAVAPEVGDSGFVVRLAGAALGAVTLGTFFVVLRRYLHRQWAKPLLGVWVYRTRPHEEAKRGDIGYGVVEFSQDLDGALHYRVDLYRTAEDAIAAAKGEPPVGESHGTAVGLTQAFDENSGALWILYQVLYYDDTEPDREGHLFLRAAGPAGHRVLRGWWASDLNGRQLSAGVMTMLRSDDFPDFVEREREGSSG